MPRAERIQDPLHHLQMVNSRRHSQIKDWLNCFRGAATKYGHSLQWFHHIQRGHQSSSGTFLHAILVMPCLRFAN